jgi:hypothetical protein
VRSAIQQSGQGRDSNQRFPFFLRSTLGPWGPHGGRTLGDTSQAQDLLPRRLFKRPWTTRGPTCGCHDDGGAMPPTRYRWQSWVSGELSLAGARENFCKGQQRRKYFGKGALEIFESWATMVRSECGVRESRCCGPPKLQWRRRCGQEIPDHDVLRKISPAPPRPEHYTSSDHMYLFIFQAIILPLAIFAVVDCSCSLRI